MRADHLLILVLQSMFYPYIYSCIYTCTRVQFRVSTAALSAPSLSPSLGGNIGKRAQPLLPVLLTSRSQEQRVTDVKSPRHDRPTAGTARKDNSEFRPNKQLPSAGVSYWNSKALFYRDKYLGENSLRQSWQPFQRLGHRRKWGIFLKRQEYDLDAGAASEGLILQDWNREVN